MSQKKIQNFCLNSVFIKMKAIARVPLILCCFQVLEGGEFIYFFVSSADISWKVNAFISVLYFFGYNYLNVIFV